MDDRQPNLGGLTRFQLERFSQVSRAATLRVDRFNAN
jgi:hypothetical protein